MDIFNLIRRKWIPVQRLKTGLDHIAPFEITSEHSTNPVIAFAWPRPDFDLASHELLIGLLAAIYPAATHKDWIKLFHEPPAPAVLEAAFEPFADAFLLDGSGPRFLQDFEALDGDILPIDELFMDTPGESTDLFVKRARYQNLSRSTAAIAIYTLQQYAPEGGRGHNTSMRGGGPLVTLALPDSGPGSGPTLWQRLWLNTPSDFRLIPSENIGAFPWLAPTRSSKNETVHESDSHRLQAFFGMPWRLRLIFSANEDGKCDLTGQPDDLVATGFIRMPYGTKYGLWRHPLSPYQFAKNKPEERRATHSPKGRLGYRQWLGAVYLSARSSGQVYEPAKVITDARPRLIDLKIGHNQARLFAAGFAMKQRKALMFVEAEMPLHLASNALLEGRISIISTMMVDAASVAASMLGISVKHALYGDKAEAKFDSTPLDTARERLWELTETSFHKTLDEAIKQLAEDTDGNAQEKLAQMWRLSLKRTALTIFDDTAPLESFETLKPQNIVEGRKQLFFSLEGYGKLGAEFFKALKLDPPEQKKKSSAPVEGKSKEDISQ